MIYFKYLKKLLLHKWYVFCAGILIGVPIFRLIIHDWSKFLPSEFFPYARYSWENKDNPLFDKHLDKNRLDKTQKDFDRAWLLHQNRNPHHWQFWILVYDEDPKVQSSLQMPQSYIREMVADWMGATRAYTKSWDMTAWLRKNQENFERHMHPTTILSTRNILMDLGYIWIHKAGAPYYDKK
jgi:hypothetical protein